MELGIIKPRDDRFDLIEKVVSKEFPEIHVTTLFYNDYKEVVTILKSKKLAVDAVLFAGVFSYRHAKFYMQPKVLWDYVPRYSGSVLRAMLEATQHGVDPKRISFDYYDDEMLNEAYAVQDKGIRKELILSCKDIFSTNCGTEGYNEVIYTFHKNCYINKKADICITSCYTAAKWLQHEGIPAIFIYPTREECHMSIHNLYMTYVARKYQKSQVVILSLEIGYPNEYSVFAQNEIRYSQDKLKMSSYLYAFAEKINATIVEVTYCNYLIFTTKSILESATENFNDFSLLEELQEQHLKVSIGIGYGETIESAKLNATKGLIQAKNFEHNTVYIYYTPEQTRGPISIVATARDTTSAIRQKLEEIAEKASINTSHVLEIYNILNRTHKHTFTIKELAGLLNITERSMNRIANNLESAGYAVVVGKKTQRRGRPSRIIELTMNFKGGGE